ncbi:hypothetical protein ACFX14_002369 [Malus domestica]
MFCSKFNINLCFASPAHPQSNGQVEPINKIIKRTLKTSLDKANKSFIKGVQPQFSKASHTLDQDSVKQNQFMVPTRASSMEGNQNSQKLHTILIKTV